MKRIAILLLVSGVFSFAGEITLTKSAILKADRSMVSLKAGTVVELLGQDEKTLTVRYGKLTGTIPAGSIGAPETAREKKQETAPAPPPPAAGGKAVTNYGKAVEKAKENVAKREKNLVKPADEITP